MLASFREGPSWMMTENNRLDIAMALLHALRQPGADLERLFAAMQLNGLLLT